MGGNLQREANRKVQFKTVVGYSSRNRGRRLRAVAGHTPIDKMPSNLYFQLPAQTLSSVTRVERNVSFLAIGWLATFISLSN